MNVEELKNFGKDIMTIQKEMKVPLNKKLKIVKAAAAYLAGIVRELDPLGFIELIKKMKQEIKTAKTMNWTYLKQKGISQKDLDSIIKKIVLAKVTGEMMGIEKAGQLWNRFSQKISYDVMEEIFAASDDFIKCGDGDFLCPFKKYYIALQDAMAKRGLQKAEVIEDTKDTFQINITYCAWVEVAKALGNPYYCYYSACYGDEVFFPKLSMKAGFEFSRKGTLALGCPACDMRFSRI